MKYYVIAGEASGDLHGSNLVRELKKTDPDAHIRAWGGDLMEEAGADIVKHYRDLAFMGFWEVLTNLRTILRNMAFCMSDIAKWKPDAVILIDYPGFNLKIAGFCKRSGIPVYYYISPQVWAWKENRVKQIRKNVDRMLVILPFEKEFYQKHHFEVDYVGHPLLDALKNRKPNEDLSARFDKPVIALLPGSRKQEIRAMLPVMSEIAGRFPDYQFVIAAAPSQDAGFYRSLLKGKDIPLVENRTYDLLSISHAALVTSGTATLETALIGVPEVVCYKGSFISYYIGRKLIRVSFISLVNLIMGREVVRELIQSDFNKKELEAETRKILDPAVRERIGNDYAELREKLGGGSASLHAAKLITGYLKDVKREETKPSANDDGR